MPAELRAALYNEARQFEDAETVERLTHLLQEVFASDAEQASQIYCGYADDPRNTDNAWMETTAFHFHVTDELGAMLPLKAGDDARKARHPRDAAMAVRACCRVSNARGAPYAQVCWLTCDDSEPRFKSLYADHKMFFEQAVKGAELPHTRPTVPA